MSARDLAVRDIMTTMHLVVLEADDSLDRADMEMSWADIRHIPVVDREGVVIGIISNRDVIAHYHLRRKDRVAVETIMTREVLTVRPETLAREAVALLIDKKIGALPVVDEGGKLVGIVTATDFLEVAFRALHGATFDTPRAEA
jgi:CBS domain-containing protein